MKVQQGAKSQWCHNDDLSEAVVMGMISEVTKKRIGVLVLKWPNRSRVVVLVFINWNLYKQNLCKFSSQRVRGLGPSRKTTSCVLISFVLVTI